jgi:phage tail sheath protein FI
MLEGVVGLTWDAADEEHARLNGQHVNVIRIVPGRGIRVMGARTLLRDGPLRFVNVRRLVNLVAESIDEATQWIPFEPHNRDLQDVVGRVVRNFLDELWRRGMLDGATAAEAYSVVCDASVNPPDESERGRLICEIGIRPPSPAEFVLLRLVKSETGTVLDTVAEPTNA